MNQSQEMLAPGIEAVREASPASQGIMSDLMMLTKARLTMLVIVTTFVGFCMASGERLDWLLLFHAVVGTSLVAASAAVLNQFIEIKVDKLMERTKVRPLPAGRMTPASAFSIGMVMGVAGIAYLAIAVNGFATLLAAATWVIYLFIYTPMKRRTCFCITIGAVAGGIPPVIGWVAARPSMDAGAWILFGILFLWQIPHFMAIAWMYRDEYAQAGFVMLRRNDISGVATAIESLIYTIALVVVTLLPTFLKLTTWVYFGGAAIFGGIMLLCAIQFLMRRDRMSARRLFFASILYLPCVLGLLIFTRA